MHYLHAVNRATHIRQELLTLIQNPGIKGDMVANEEAFEQTWLKLYEDAKSSSLGLEFASRTIKRQNILSLYLSAIALLTCGRLEVVEDIIIGVKSNVPFHLGLLGVSALGLLPYPRVEGHKQDFDDINSWTTMNRSNLYWRPEKGLYELK